jgi:hypothetical protein
MICLSNISSPSGYFSLAKFNGTYVPALYSLASKMFMVELILKGGDEELAWGSWMEEGEEKGLGMARKEGREEEGEIGKGEEDDVGRAPEGEEMCMQGWERARERRKEASHLEGGKKGHEAKMS